jgi:DNA polymerase-1
LRALLDLDIYSYRTAAASENEDLPIAIYRLEEAIDKTLNAVGADEFSGFLSGDNNFRYTIFPEYKKNRKDMVRPRHLTDLKDYLQKKYNAVVSDGCEADDLLGIEQCQHYMGMEGKWPTIICGLDKDLLQVPGKHYSFEISGTSPKTGERWVREERFQEVSEWDGLRFFYSQLLIGDSTDGIKGAAGIGKVKAEAILRDCTDEKELFDAVRACYGSDEEMLMNARCLYIWRKPADDWTETFNKLKGNE